MTKYLCALKQGKAPETGNDGFYDGGSDEGSTHSEDDRDISVLLSSGRCVIRG